MTQSTFLVSSAPEFQGAALNELRLCDPRLAYGESLAPDTFTVRTERSEDALATTFAEMEPTYTRHLFPVQAHVALAGTLTDLDAMRAAVQGLPGLATVPADATFSVQARWLADKLSDAEEFDDVDVDVDVVAQKPSHNPTARPYTAFAIKEILAPLIASETGARESVTAPDWVLSVVCAERQAWIGLSPARWNLSNWAGGMHRFARHPEQISRAEFKLQEALEAFDVALPTRGTALDLGAAPGGWTRLLLEAGLQVVAVDPAALDPRLVKNPALAHYRGYAQDFLNAALREDKRSNYAMIVSDLRVDVFEAARLMADYAALLAPNGVLITTLKLPHATRTVKPEALARKALKMLGQTFSTVRARQLFHNRQEITVLLRK